MTTRDFSPQTFLFLAVTALLTGCDSTKIGQPRERVAEINAISEPNELISILHDDGLPLNRAAAATGLGRLKDPKAVESLVQGLQDADAGVRRDCAHALGDIKDKLATKPLCEALAEDRVVDVRRAAARALNDLADEKAKPALTAALKDPNESVAYNAYRALISITGRTDLGRSYGEWEQLLDK